MTNSNVKNRKILLVCTRLESFLHFREELVQELIDRGYFVTIAYTDCKGHYEEHFNGVALIRYGAGITNYNNIVLRTISYFYKSLSLRKLISSLQPDIIFAFFIPGMFASYLATLFNRLSESMLIGSLEGFGRLFPSDTQKDSFKQKIILFLLGKVFSGFDRIVLMNRIDYDRVSSFTKGVELVNMGPIGVDLDKFTLKTSTSQDDSIKIVYIGRLLKSKGIVEYFKFIDHLKSRGSIVDPIIIGEPDAENPDSISKNELMENVAKLDINYIGFVTDPETHLAGRDFLFFHSSYGEGFPRVIQEAMACGVVPVVWDNPIITDGLSQGVDSIIYSDIEESADVFLELLASVDRCNLSKAARYHALEVFDVYTNINRLLRCLDL